MERENRGQRAALQDGIVWEVAPASLTPRVWRDSICKACHQSQPGASARSLLKSAGLKGQHRWSLGKHCTDFSLRCVPGAVTLSCKPTRASHRTSKQRTPAGAPGKSSKISGSFWLSDPHFWSLFFSVIPSLSLSPTSSLVFLHHLWFCLFLGSAFPLRLSPGSTHRP